MKLIWGYSDFLNLLDSRPGVRNGIIVDTNVLISATYDFDKFYEQTNDLFNLISENNIPLFCNVNVRAEFLEIQRRIAFTESLLSFEQVTEKASLPVDLQKKLKSIRSNQLKREADGRDPLRLSEADIKDFKSMMIRESTSKGNLWHIFCKEHVGDQLFDIWDFVVSEFGLNFLSLRHEDQQSYINTPPSWEATVELMSSEGISSSDAMIVNMFQSSKFELILSSDADVGIAVVGMQNVNKVCMLPDKVVSEIEIAI